MSEWVRVCDADSVAAGTLKAANAAGQPVVLANVDGDVYALEDRCSHEAFPLSDGELDGDEVICLHHGARFEACTGRNKGLPAVRPVKAFPVQMRDGGIYVEV